MSLVMYGTNGDNSRSLATRLVGTCSERGRNGERGRNVGVILTCVLGVQYLYTQFGGLTRTH